MTKQDSDLDIANEVASIMRATHQHIIDGTFINGLTPHQYTTKAVEHLILQERINELKNCLRNVPMPTLSYEQVEHRIEELKRGRV